MIKSINNWNTQEAAKDFTPLPVDGYVCKIMGTRVQTCSNGLEMLVVSIDILDGEFANYYADEYRNQQNEDKKWKGNLRLFIPTDERSEQAERTRRNFKTFTNALEDSNLNYHWDWDETRLKGLKLGVVFRNEQWVFDGKSGWKAQPFKCVSVEDIETNNFTIPKEKPHKDALPVNYPSTTEIVQELPLDDDMGDLPF